MPEILIVGYGNLLNGDDAIGCHVAQALEEHFRGDPEVEVIASQRLTPEMAEDVARSRFVIFLDAIPGATPGTVRRAATSSAPGPGGFGHDLTPAALLAAVEQLYGDAPSAVTFTMEGWSFETGQRLSPQARQHISGLVREVVEFVTRRVQGDRDKLPSCV